MKKLTALILTALLLVVSTAFAAKPGSEPASSQSPLRALWYSEAGLLPNCLRFVLLESHTYIYNSDNQVKMWRVSPTGNVDLNLAKFFDTFAETEEAMILLFIRINDLDMTLADVPVDGTGAYDCAAWNSQLIGY